MVYFCICRHIWLWGKAPQTCSMGLAASHLYTPALWCKLLKSEDVREKGGFHWRLYHEATILGPGADHESQRIDWRRHLPIFWVDYQTQCHFCCAWSAVPYRPWVSCPFSQSYSTGSSIKFQEYASHVTFRVSEFPVFAPPIGQQIFLTRLGHDCNCTYLLYFIWIDGKPFRRSLCGIALQARCRRSIWSLIERGRVAARSQECRLRHFQHRQASMPQDEWHVCKVLMSWWMN